jgi:tetratricopeptide (TPR) repeat protein
MGPNRSKFNWLVALIVLAMAHAASPLRAETVTAAPNPVAPSPAATQPAIGGSKEASAWLDQANRHAQAISENLDAGQLQGAIAIGYARCGDEDRMRSSMRLAEKLLVVPAGADNPLDKLYAQSLPDIVRCMARHGDLQSAAAMQKRYGTDRIDHLAVKTAIAVGQSEAGDIPGAQVTLAEMGEIVHNDGCTQIARALADQGHIDDARASADAIADPSWKAGAYVAIATAQAKNGDDAGAMDTADRIPEGPSKADALRVIAAYRASRGDDAGAAACAQLISDIPAQSHAFLAIGKCQIQRKDFAAAANTLERTIDSDRQLMLRYLAIGNANADNIAAANDLLRLIVDIPSQKLVCRAIMYAMVRQNDIFGAKSFLQPLPQDQRIELLLALARIAAEVGNPDIALRILREVETGVVNPGTRVIGPLIRFKAGDKEGFRAAISAMESEASTSTNAIVRAKANALLFTVKSITGDYAGARLAATKVSDANLAFLVSATTARMDAGDASDAVAMASALPSIPMQISSYSAIATHYITNGKTADFPKLIRSLPAARDKAACCIGIAQALLTPPSPAD